MNIAEWRAAVSEQAQRLSDRLRTLARQAEQRVPGLVYGATAWLAFLPLVAAVKGGTLPYAELIALLGSAGINLLSSELYAWKERSKEQLDIELPERLAQLAQQTEWRDLLDKLIAKAETQTAVQGALAADAAPYLDALQKDVSRLAVFVVGGGTVTVHETHIHIEKIVAFYRKPDESLDEADLASQIRQYLAWIIDRYGKIVMRGVEYRGLNVINLDLDQVYVPLQAQTRRAGAQQQIDIRLDQLLPLAPQLIITGGPGSGKTTVLQHIAWSLAMGLTQDPALAARALGLDTLPELRLPLPLYLPLSRYHSYRRELRQQGGVDAPHRVTLHSFLSHYLIERSTVLRLPPDFFVRLIENSQALILLLDGLDEVPDDTERSGICQAVEDLVAGRPELRTLVTCRTAAYQGQTLLNAKFHQVQVKPLAEAQVEQLVMQAFACIEPVDTSTREQNIKKLNDGIRTFEAERKTRMGAGYKRLIDSPLMVRMLLLVFLTGRGFPEQRADLYEKATRTLLQPDYGLDDEAAQEIGRLVGGDPGLHRKLVEHLAFHMHQAGSSQSRDLSKDELERIIQQENDLARLAEPFVALTRVRGGLVEERWGAYRFFHLAFQEYLTASYLVKTRLGEGGVDRIAAFLEQGPLLESWWREPALLIAGYFGSNNDRINDRRFVCRLAGIDRPPDQTAALSADIQLAAVEIALLSCLEWLGTDVDLRQKLAQWAAGILNDRALMTQSKPRVRAAAGNA
ncbi:MAG: NACHT domain-containing protein, partial [Caldilinea sp.]